MRRECAGLKAARRAMHQKPTVQETVHEEVVKLKFSELEQLHKAVSFILASENLGLEEKEVRTLKILKEKINRAAFGE